MAPEEKEALKQKLLLKRLQKAAKPVVQQEYKIPLVDRNAPIPLSWAQQRLWFIAQLDAQASRAYHITCNLRLLGNLQRAALISSLNALVERHEVLRTTFAHSDDEPRQVIRSESQFSLQYRDFSLLDATAQADAVAAEKLAESTTEFDLQNGPLIRGRLLHLGANSTAEDVHVLLVTMHHIVSDAWSMGIVIQELSALYCAVVQGEGYPLPPLGLQYADYAHWQRTHMDQAKLEQQKSYWCEQLSVAPTLLSLPLDRPRPSQQDFKGKLVELQLSGRLSEQLRLLAKSYGMTLSMLLMGTWSLLMSRLSGQAQVVLGTPVANRPRAELEGLIGFFVNTLAIGVDVDETLTTAEFFAHVKRQCLGAFAHQDLPFEQVVEVLQPQRSLHHSPIFQVMFAFESQGEGGEQSLAGVRIQEELESTDGLDTRRVQAKFDLFLSLTDIGTETAEIVGALTYATALFDAHTVERWITHFKTLLQSLVDAAFNDAFNETSCPLHQLIMLTELDRQQLVHTFNDTAVAFPRERCIHQCFEDWAARAPNAIALECGERRVTYAQLNEQANQLAHSLVSQGVQPDNLVGLLVHRSVEMVVALLGILKAGGAYLPLDPAYPDERLEFMLADAGVSVVVTEKRLQSHPALTTKTILCLDEETPALTWPTHNLDVAHTGVTADHLAYVMYTSGTTGEPKGVLVEQHAVTSLVVNNHFVPLSPATVMLQSASLSFDAATLEIWGPLLNGGRLVIFPDQYTDPQRIAGVIQQHGVNTAWMTSGLFDQFVSLVQDPIPSLHYLLVGGDVVKNSSVTAMQRRNPQVRCINGYGPTENTTFTLCYPIPLDFTQPSIPVGKIILNRTAYALDTYLNPVPIGVVGELYVGGEGLARGYLNRPELTAKHFITNPFHQHGAANSSTHLYKTGDLVRWQEDGNLLFCGRNDQQVKLRGFRIELAEIEAQLARLADVREALVLVVEHAAGDRQLVAYVTPAHGREGSPKLEPSPLRQALKSVLPEFMVPDQIMVLSEFPLTANGKIDRRALPAADSSTFERPEFSSPEGELEQGLAQIWQELLALSQVGRADNFFELGGHSLLAVQVVARVERQLGRSMSLKNLFDAPVLADLAILLERASRQNHQAILPVNRHQLLPLSWAQQRLWFLAQLDPAASRAYHMSARLRLSGELNVPALQNALNSVLQRHESLRTTFTQFDGQPNQVIHDNMTFPLQRVDLAELPAIALDHALDSHKTEETNAPFDMQTGPLIRGRLIHLGRNSAGTLEHVFLVTMHHIIFDGWSQGIFIEEMGRWYEAYRLGQADPLPRLEIQYADYAHWQRTVVAEQRLAEQQVYWQTQLRELPPLLSLPLDYPRKTHQDYTGASVPVELSADLSQQLIALAKTHGLTLHMLLIGVWGLLMSRLSGQAKVVIGTPVANRPRAELESMIGFFVNTLAIRFDIDEHATVGAFLTHVKEQALGAYAHQDLPFEQIVEVVQPTRSLNHSPLFQAAFTFANLPLESDLELPGLTLSAEPDSDQTGQERAQFDLALALGEIREQEGTVIAGSLTYASGLFEAQTVQRWTGHFKVLLEGLVNACGDLHATPLLSVAWLSELERKQLGGLHDRGVGAGSVELCVHQLFEMRANTYPAAVAVQDDSQCVTYAELNQRANQLAHRLVAEGVRCETFVALCAERTVAQVVGLLAILKAGGTYVPLDPSYPQERLEYLLADSVVTLVLTQRHLLEQLPLSNRRVLCLDEPARDSDLPRAEVSPSVEGLTPNHLAYVIYTSGTTGQPKGVLIPHRNLSTLLVQSGRDFSVTAGDCMPVLAAPAFDIAVWELLLPLSCGARALLVSREQIIDIPQLHSRLRTCTLLHTVPSLMEALLNYDQEYANNQPGLAATRSFFVGGDRVPRSLLKRMLQRYPRATVVELYGPTEATVLTSWHRVQADDISANAVIGRVFPQAQAYVLDPYGRLAPIGVVGELHIAGAGLAKGYLNRPELTADKFIPNPYYGLNPAASSERMYKSGDLVRWLADGTLAFVGRNDNQVKIRGYRIELGEIEAHLARQTGVREALVLSYRNAAGSQELVAYLVPTPATAAGQTFDLLRLRQALKSALPDYMLPAEIILLEEFPLTSHGKLDRKALPTPDGSGLQRCDFEAPQGDLEQALAGIWQELLKVEKVGRQDNFFDLGGHSLLIVLLVELLRNRGWEVRVQDVFTNPVLSVLAEVIEAEQSQRYAAPTNLIEADSQFLTPAMLPLFKLRQGATDLTSSDVDEIIRQVPGGVGNIQDIYPLAPLQEGILFHHRLSERDTYVIPTLLKVANEQQLNGFLAALQAVVKRHDILRTAFLWKGLSQSVQVVYRHAELPVEIITLTADSDEQQQMESRMALTDLWVDVQRAPLLNIQVAHSLQGEYAYVLIQKHHLISDHVSGAILLNEVQTILEGEEALLSSPMPYRNFVAHTLAQSNGQEAESYFRGCLGDIDEPTAPFNLLDVHGDGSDVRTAHRSLTPELAVQIRQVARDMKVTPATLFHMAWGLVVSRCSGRTEVVFGTMMSGRLQGVEGADRILGMFLNLLPLRLSVHPTLAVEAFVRQVHRALTGLLPFEQIPLTQLQPYSGVPNGTPLFSAVLNYRHSTPHSEAESRSAEAVSTGFEGIEVLSIDDRSNYPFTLSVDDLATTFGLKAQVAVPVAAERVLDYMQETLTQLVDLLARTPHTLLQSVSVIPAHERNRLVQEFNHSSESALPSQCVHQLFEEQVAVFPHAVAAEQAGLSLSYTELNEKANQLARQLIANGVAPEERVALCVESGFELLIGLLAILKAGAVYVPIDPSYPPERIRYLLRDSGVATVLTQADLLSQLPISSQSTLCIDQTEIYASQPRQNPDAPALGLTPAQLAYVIYTSGTTGEPKGVLVPHTNLSTFLLNAAREFSVGPGDRMPLLASPAFDIALFEILLPLTSGATAVLVDRDAVRDVAQLHQRLQGCSLLHAVPSLMAALLHQDEHTQGDGLAAVRRFFVGGDQVPEELLQRLSKRYSQAVIYELYGPTEATILTTWRRYDSNQTLPSSTIGRVLPHAQAYVLGSQQELVPLGVVGELYIGGVGVARGYLNRPELSAERFITNPYYRRRDPLSSYRLYKTGDLVRWLDDGQLVFLGRNDQQVKIRGYRIELGEIETQLQRCAGVKEAVVIAHRDARRDPRLVAYITASDATEPLHLDTLRQALLSTLPDYMVPSEIVPLDTLPLTSHGKLERNALPAPDGSGLVRSAYSAPQGEVEIALAQIWQEVLRVPRVGRFDHFFALGGHSLLGVQMVTWVEQKLGRTLALKSLFEAPVLADLALLVAAADSPLQSEIVGVDRTPGVVLSWAQQRLWFIAQMDPEASRAYHMMTALRFVGELNIPALKTTFNALMERHEGLRTSFVQSQGSPLQVIHSNAEFALSHVDLSELEGEQKTQAVALQKELESTQDFAMESDPLIRGRLIYLGLNSDGQNEYVLLVTIHHIVTDAWSQGILGREIRTLYDAFCQGLENPLPPLAIQYADYAHWQRTCIGDSLLEAQQSYWLEQLGDAPPLLELPLDRPRPEQQVYAGGNVELRFSAQLTANLNALAQAQGMTLHMLLLAAWGVLLARLSSQASVVIGTPVANRSRPELEGLIGFFVNTLAIRLDVDETDSLVAFLERVKAQALGAYAHQDLPFEQVVELLQPTRSLNHSPIFQVMFALENTPHTGDFALRGLSLQTDQDDASDQGVLAHYDLALSLREAHWEEGTQLVGALTYAKSLFDEATIERWAGYFSELLYNLVDASACATITPLCSLSMLGESERHQVLNEFNDSAVVFADDLCIQQLFEERVALAPDSVALVFQQQNVTYDQLNSRANQLAHYLVAEGIKPDNLVGLCMERSIDMVVGILGILKAGGVYVPIDPTYPHERVLYMLADAGVSILLTLSRVLSELPEVECRTVCLDTLEQVGAAPSINLDPAELGLSAEHLAYAIYTSGTTGLPKGVLNHHRGLCYLARAQIERFNVEPHSRVLQFASSSFDASVSECFMSLCAGAQLHLAEQSALMPSEPLVDLLQQQAITHVTLPPSILSAIHPGASLAHLTNLIVAGEACAVELAQQWSHGRNFFNAYGPTEAAVCATIGAYRAGEDFNLGRPMANVRVYILDRYGNPVPRGVTGEICIGGAGVARGYHNRPELNAAKFGPDPFVESPTARLYKSGDLGAWNDDGSIRYLGRNDQQVKVRGVRIELGEIEGQMLQHNSVQQAVVVPRETAAGKSLVAYFVPKPEPKAIELWPSVAEFFVYDELLYHSMYSDTERNQRYRNAFAKKLSGKTVVEIGPGPQAVLARLCLEAGAEKVYAIEYLEQTYRQAKAFLESLDLQEKIILIHGDARHVELPEQVDYCISEIVGGIGGSEGAAVILNEAKRFLRDPSCILPERTETKIAAITLPEDSVAYHFSPTAGHYVEQIFAQQGRNFDLRIALKNLSQDQLISSVATFEDLNHKLVVPATDQHEIKLTFAKNTLFNGFLVWLNLHVDDENTIDIMQLTASWLPVYFPISVPGIAVTEGDVIEATISRSLCGDGLHPEFLIKGRLVHVDGRVAPIEYFAEHAPSAFKASPFYDKLFSDGVNIVDEPSQIDRLREHLERRLPSHMLPSALVPLESLPLTANGKVNRLALPAADAIGAQHKVFEPPKGELEQRMAELWQELLEVKQVGRNDHFFELGGHSLLAAQLINKIKQIWNLDVTLMDLFQHAEFKYFVGKITEYELTKYQSSDLSEASAALMELSDEELKKLLEEV